MKRSKRLVALFLCMSMIASSYLSAMSVQAVGTAPIETENYEASQTEDKNLQDQNSSNEMTGEELDSSNSAVQTNLTGRELRDVPSTPSPEITPESWGFDLDGALNNGLLTHETYADPITGQTIKYWFHAPADYKTKKYPVVMFMHGHGDGGSDTQTNIRKHVGIIYQLLNEENQRDNPCIIIAPQTPGTHDKWVDVPAWATTGWKMDEMPRNMLLNTVYDLYNDVQLKYNGDKDRAYVTGLSMGGFATWDLITRNPGKFAAAAPICGAGDPSKAAQLRRMPIWSFHGTKDDVVPVGSTKAMYEALKGYGNMQYTEYPAESHSSWNSAYGKDNVQGLIDWMFAQNLKDQKEPETSTSKVSNVAMGCNITATGGGDANRPVAMAVDGVIGETSSAFNYGEFGTNDGLNKQSRYIQFDLGKQYDIQKMKMWRYWDDGRQYDNTVIALSEDGDFTPGSPAVVYNSDTGNKHGFGAGGDQGYEETNAGREFILNSQVRAQYIRIYMYGYTPGGGGSNHIVEFQAFAEKEIIPAPNVEDEKARLKKLMEGNDPIQWVFAGDSITHACAWTNYQKGYSQYFEQRLKAEEVFGKVRSEDMVINQGISGATTSYVTSDFNSWVDTKLDPRFPSVMFVAFGMNDKLQDNNFSKPLSVAEFTANLNLIVDKIRGAGGIPILQTPNPVKPIGDFYGCVERRPILDQYANAVRSVASDKGAILIDINQHWRDELSLGTDVFAEWMPSDDGIHPDANGHLDWAKYIFKQLDIYDENSAICSMTKEDLDLTNDGDNIHPDEMVLDSEKLVPERRYEPVLQYDVNKYFTDNQLIDQSQDLDVLKAMREGTIVARFKTTDGRGAQTLFSADNKSEAGSIYDVQLVLGVNDYGRLYYFLSNGTNNLYMHTENLNISDGRWHTVVLLSEASQISMYVDGNKVTMSNAGSGYENSQFAYGLPGLDSITIGGAKRGSKVGVADWFYHGNISYVDVYSQIFTQEEAVKRSSENVDSYALQIKSKVNEQARNPWVFLGGETSIENQKEPSARNFIDLFQEVYRYEHANENRMHGFFINRSISGKPMQYYLDNYESAIGRFKPVFAVVTPDIFDRDLVLTENSPADFRIQLDALLTQLKADNVITILQSPAMVGDTEKNKVLGEYVEQMTQAAEGKNLVYVNHYAYFNSVANNNPRTSELWLQDGKFPNETGNLVMARRLLAAINYNIPNESRIKTLTFATGSETEQEDFKAEVTVTGEDTVTLNIVDLKKNSAYLFEEFQVYQGTNQIAQAEAREDAITLTGLAKEKIDLTLHGIVRLNDGRTKTVIFTQIQVDLSPAVDKSSLKTLIDQVSALDLSKYTDASKAVLTNALSEARKVYEDGNADQKLVNSARAILDQAVKGLVLKPVKVTLTYKADTNGKIVGASVQLLDKGTMGSSVEAVADKGYEFSKWSDGKTSALRSDKADNNITYTAFFVKAKEPVTPQKPEPKQVKLNGKNLIIGVKEKVVLKAKVLPAGAVQKVTWSSDHKSIAKVNSKGEVVGTKPGTAKIKAKASNGKYVICKVRVRKAPSKVTLNEEKKTLKVGMKFRLKVKLPANTASYKLTYTSGNKSVAVVSADGLITAKKKGTANIKVRTFNGKTDTIKITVKK